MSQPQLEVADVVRQYGDAYLERYGHSLSGVQHRALRAIAMCRTARLGGHKTQCEHCGHQEMAYNSCRDRHCPKCHGTAQAAWLAARQSEVLDVPYVHVVFTLPHLLSPLTLQNPRLLYDCLFRTVSQSLLDIARDPKHLGAELGVLAVLHTWGQTLHHHPHLHCLIPAGGLAPEGNRWVACRPNFFLPVKVLRRRFRHLFLQTLASAYRHQKLSFEGRCQQMAVPKTWQRFLSALQDTEWVVYAKAPMRQSGHLLKYLARYSHRVAISNPRLVAMQDEKVTFKWKDYKHGRRLRTMTLEAVEFIHRFLLHILPRRFQRIRHYGLLANKVRQAKLAQCRTLLKQAMFEHASGKAPPNPEDEMARRDTPTVCPVCQQGQMQVVETFYLHRAFWDLSVAVPIDDTS